MALYHAKAEALKELVSEAKFSPEQMNVVRKMMTGCSQLRQAKVINSFWELMVPENMTIETIQEEGKYGSYSVPVARAKEGSN